MTAPQSDSKSPSRRALLAGALGGIGAWAASAIGRAAPVRATDGQALVVGQVNTTAGQTTLGNNTNAETVMWVASNDDALGNNSGHGTAVTGFSAHGIALEGWSNGTYGVYGHSSSIGVFGVTSSASAYGVLGHNNGGGSGTAVRGWTGGATGTGVEGYAGSFSGANRGVWGATRPAPLVRASPASRALAAVRPSASRASAPALLELEPPASRPAARAWRDTAASGRSLPPRPRRGCTAMPTRTSSAPE